MKRLALAATLALAMFGAGCDDDNDDNNRDGGRDATADGRDGGDAGMMCTGTFATLNRTQLGAATAAAGACRAAADLDQICTADIGTKARSCGSSCAMYNLTGDALLDCVKNCLRSGQMVLTAGCADCYSNLFDCTIRLCSTDCTADPNSVACRTCQANRGCMGTFFTCTGLPGGTPSDAGADTGTDSRDATPDTTGDVNRDTPADVPATDARDGGVDAVDGGADAADGGADASDATAG